MPLLEIAALLKECTFNDWKFQVGGDSYTPLLRVVFDDSAGKRWNGRWWRLSVHMTKSEVVQTAFKAVMTAVEHETREAFRYKGRAIFGPHFDVDRLAELCDEGGLDVRAAPS